MSEFRTPFPSNLQNVHLVVHTKYEESERFSFLWIIDNYAKILEGDQPPDKISSPILQGGPRSNHSWQLILYPKMFKDDQTYLALYAHLMAFGDGDHSPGRSLKTYFQFSLLDSNDQLLTWSNGCKNYELGMSWGFNQFLPSAAVTSPSNQFLTNDILKVQLDLTIQGNLIHGVAKGNHRKIPTKTKLQQRNIQFGKMFKDSMFTDLTVEGPTKSYEAHKCVLAAASPVFAAMLTTDMLEKETGKVSIKDFDDEVIKSLLEYVYQGELSLTDAEKLSKLMLAADKYDLRLLKSECEILLMKCLTLTPNTAPVNLVIADSSNASNLKDFVVAYIKRNFDTVKQTKEFKDLIKSPRADLVFETL